MAMLLMATGAATWLNQGHSGPYILAAGLGLLVYMLFGWFGTVIRESEAGCTTSRWTVPIAGAWAGSSSRR
jgi:cytochrome c oxidase subunit 3